MCFHFCEDLERCLLFVALMNIELFRHASFSMLSLSDRCRSPVVQLDAKDGSVIYEVPSSDLTVQTGSGHVAWWQNFFEI